MSVTVIGRFPVANIEKAIAGLQANAALLEEITEDTKAGGLIHHTFVGGEGELVVIDEWGNAEQFQKFFERNTKIEEFVVGTGATGAPAISVFDSVEMPGTF